MKTTITGKGGGGALCRPTATRGERRLTGRGGAVTRARNLTTPGLEAGEGTVPEAVEEGTTAAGAAARTPPGP